jgi:hypothetical protein
MVTGVSESRVGAAEVVRDARQPFGEVLHVDLVDHRLGERPVRRDVALPVERLVDHDTSGHVCLGVAVVPQPGVAGQLDPDLVAEDRRCQPDVALDRAGVGVEQKLGLVVSADRSPAATDQRPGPRSVAPASPRAGARTRTRVRAR